METAAEIPSRAAGRTSNGALYVLRFATVDEARGAVEAIQRLLDSPFGAAFSRGGLEARILRDAADWEPVLYFSSGARAAGRMAGIRLPDSEGTIQADAMRHASLLASPDAQESIGTDAGVHPDRLRVLVVEDQQDTATMLAALLTAWGFEAEVAHTGADALRLAPEFTPRVVLLDLGLPDQHGYRLARRLREEIRSPIAFVVVTGWSQRVDQELSAAAGISHHLVKPVNPDALHSILQRYEDSGTH